MTAARSAPGRCRPRNFRGAARPRRAAGRKLRYRILRRRFRRLPGDFSGAGASHPTVWVFGGGHVSFFLVRAAKLAGFRAKVIDDRPAFANQERFPEADGDDRHGIRPGARGVRLRPRRLRGSRDARPPARPAYSGADYDCGARYLGMIGSKSKISKMWQRLEAKGIDRRYLDRVHAPVGLNIGADSPEESASASWPRSSASGASARCRPPATNAATTSAARPWRKPRRRKPSGETRATGAARNPPATPETAWLRVKLPAGKTYSEVKSLVRQHRLHTVCEEAMCPNIGECWEQRSATLMLLGDTCTRSCGFCAVRTGRPDGVDEQEPERVVETIATLGLRYAVVTSVNRDDLSDGGSHIFAVVIRGVRQHVPGCRIEVLIPDFKGNWEALAEVVEAGPHVLNHNMESIARALRHGQAQANTSGLWSCCGG